MGLMALLGNEVVITSNFPEIIGTKYFTVGRELRGHLIITVIFVQQFHRFNQSSHLPHETHWAGITITFLLLKELCFRKVT